MCCFNMFNNVQLLKKNTHVSCIKFLVYNFNLCCNVVCVSAEVIFKFENILQIYVGNRIGIRNSASVH